MCVCVWECERERERERERIQANATEYLSRCKLMKNKTVRKC